MLNVTLLLGGTSDERAVSLRSGLSVAKALEQNKYTVTLLDPADGLDKLGKPDLVFSVLHGRGGEDGAMQNELEKRHVSFVGSDSKTSKLCFDKWAYKRVLLQHKILTPKDELLTYGAFLNSKITQNPFVLKPSNGGSSIDTFIVRDPKHFDGEAIKKAFKKHHVMLLEELIEGVELTASVLGDRALAIVEIVPPAGLEFDYENKYNGASAEFCPPKHISPATQKRAQQLALKIHKLVKCRDLSRTDMIVTADNQLYVLETNTLPGMTENSLFPKAAAASGLDMTKLAHELVRLAQARP